MSELMIPALRVGFINGNNNTGILRFGYYDMNRPIV
jgi:hypothetical protein